MSSNRYRFLAHTNIIVGVIAALTVTLVVLTVPGIRRSSGNFLTQSLTHQPERLTELYFTDPASIPTTYEAGQPLHLSFTVHNLEYRDMTYYYRVYADTTSAPAQMLTVRDGAFTVVEVSLPAKDYGQRTEVNVELVGQRETIHFWVERRP